MRITALIAAGTALAVGCGAAAGTRPQASVRIVSVVPIAQASGRHFVARERVTATLRAGTAVRVRHVRATRRGTFVARFGVLDDSDRCGSKPSVVAVGAKGDRAAYTMPGRLECPPPNDD
jgi:hypothetical protein